MPTSRTDYLAMLHDIDYLIYNNDPKKISASDDFAIDNAQLAYKPFGGSFGITMAPDPFNDMLQASAMKTGLSARKFLNLDVYSSNRPEQQTDIGYRLKQSVISNPRLQQLALEYNVPLEKWYNNKY